MTCPHCGAEVIPGHRFCQQCRRRVAENPSARAASPAGDDSAPARRPGPAAVPAAFDRPLPVTILAVLNLVGGVLAALAGVALALLVLVGSAQGDGPGERVVFLAFGAVLLLIGVLQVVTGIGLLKLRPWARTLEIVVAGIGLLGIPCGTIVSVLILVYMLKPEVRTLFSDVPPRRLPPEEVARVQALSQGSAGSTIAVMVGVVAVGLVAVAVVGIVAAIAIPSLLRARVSANEAAAIGDLRTVVSAQAAYQAANNGFYDELGCLAAPSGCIPGYPASAPVFVDQAMLEGQRHGYTFELVTAEPASEEVVQHGQLSPSSAEGFAYFAVPVQAGQTGIRSFCADATGLVCAMQGQIPQNEGVCPGSCEPLR
jgi:type II secretory pathway pseudopilin PulG